MQTVPVSALVLFTLVYTMSSAAAQTPMGALAVDERQGDQYGWAVDYETAAAAQARALSECGGGCRVVLTFARCAAYAADQDADSTAVGWAESYGAASSAQQAALSECNSRGGSGCIVRVWGCNGPVVEAGLGLDRTARQQIQRGLQTAGFDPGGADGLFGPRTRAAIRGWQSSRGSRATGYLDGASATALRSAAPGPTVATPPAPAAQQPPAGGWRRQASTRAVRTVCLVRGLGLRSGAGDKILDGLRAADRTLFVRWDLYPPPPGPVPISDRQLPRTLQEIDAEIQRLEAHLEKCLEEEGEEDKRQHARRMTIIGGALLGLVESGDAEADAMLKTILPSIPKKERAPFEGWTPPTLPVAAAQAAQKEAPRRNDGPGHSSSASPPDAHGKDEPARPASNVAHTSTTTAAGGDEAAARQRRGEGATPAAASRQRRGRTGDGATRSSPPRGDEKDPGYG